MRYLVMSDVHANLEALEAVLADAPPHDAVLCLGDLVGYGPDPNECVERVRALPNLTCLVGNHDLAALGRADPDAFNDVAREAALWTAEALSPTNRDFLAGLSPTGGADGYFLAHGSPRDPIWEYLEFGSQARASFGLFTQAVCFVGHTHVPRVLLEGSEPGRSVPPARAGECVRTTEPPRSIVNPGGVGQPRDGDPRAAYGVWDTGTSEFVFRRVDYAIGVTQQKILSAGLPASLAYRLAAGM
jgi:diadenosine tetraphosphatase ApaH/serine/threonine PP2A family protein phosphatase